VNTLLSKQWAMPAPLILLPHISLLIHVPKRTQSSNKNCYTGLQKHLPSGYTFEKFDNADASGTAVGKIGSKKVLPTISDDLKKGAVKATIFAILVIFLYIFIRFRDWRYSIGTIIALLHDVLGNIDCLLFWTFTQSSVCIRNRPALYCGYTDGDWILDERSCDHL
jgi:hypothetical protein